MRKPLLWVSKSHAKLAAALRALEVQPLRHYVGKLLHYLGYKPLRQP